MSKDVLLFTVVIVVCFSISAGAAGFETETTVEKSEKAPWIGKYPMSFFTKTRTANTVGKDRLSVCVKVQYFDWSKKRGSDNDYHCLSGQSKRKLSTTFVSKYGWAENHHIAVCVPMLFNDFDLGTSDNRSKGLGNILIFEKWNLIKETNHRPGVAIDFGYYLPTGDTDRKLGSDDGAYKIATEVSKAWKDFSLHFNPCYTWDEDKDADIGEINAAILTKPLPKLWTGIEYNYFDKEGCGYRHDLVPGVIWKYAKNGSFKVGVPITLDSTETYKDVVGLVFKLFYKF